MRSLSNLYKRPYVMEEEKRTRVINSNELVEKKLQELFKRQSAQTPEGTEEGFVPGIEAPEVPIEPERDYVAEAKEEAEQILTEARAQAAQVQSEAEQAAETLKQQAKEEGYQTGYQQGSETAAQELAVKTKELEDKKREVVANYEEQLAAIEPQLLDVILQVVEKVFHIQFADKKEILLYLLSNAINGIEGCKNFQIRVGQDNYRFVKEHQEGIKARIGNDISIEVLEDVMLEDDKCMIETDAGVFDCSLGVQLENLIKTLRSLCI